MIIPSEEIQHNLERIGEVVKGAKRLIVLTHDNPDPDSVSSALALAYLIQNKYQVPASVKYSGIVGRAENQAMIRVLRLKVSALKDSDFKPGVEFALVDSQPKTGNNSFPKNRKPMIVIDHHPLRKTTKADFLDVRTGYGATATILTEYLIESGLEIPSSLATALSYGISSETQDLGREAGEKEIQAELGLFPKSNKKRLASIKQPSLPRDYFMMLNRALHHTVVYKSAMVKSLGEIDGPDYVAFIADFMLKCERMTWSMCLGRFKDKIIVSIRTTNVKGSAGRFLRALIGNKGTAGGHGMIAGGQIACPSMEHDRCTQAEDELTQDFFKKLGYKEVSETTPLLTKELIRSDS